MYSLLFRLVGWLIGRSVTSLLLSYKAFLGKKAGDIRSSAEEKLLYSSVVGCFNEVDTNSRNCRL
jgi:hypothetical protein